jgi:hypothetical protein
MLRRVTALLIVTTAVPALAPAQAPRPSTSLTIFAGYNLGFTSAGDLALNLQGQEFSGAVEQEVGGGAALGGGVSLPVSRFVSILGEGAWSRMGDVVSTFTAAGEAEVSESEGGTMWLAKLGLGFRVPTRLPLVISAAPALVRLDPADEGDEDGLTDGHSNLGFSIGVSTVFPLSDRIGLRAAAEDYLVFWNEEEQEMRLRNVFERQAGGPVDADVTIRRSHIPVVRVGFSFQW